MAETFAQLFIIILTLVIPGLLSVAAKKKKDAEKARQAPALPQTEAPKGRSFDDAPAFSSSFAPAAMDGEGRDTCHAYMLDMGAEDETPADTPDPANANLSNELVRSFIFSEILQRPRSVRGRQGT